MDFILGIITGFISGFGLLYIQYHKSEISHSIVNMREDISSIHVSLEKILNSIQIK